MSNRLKTVSIFSLLALLATAAWSGYSHYASPTVESSSLDSTVDTTDKVLTPPPTSESSVVFVDQEKKGLKQLKAELNSLREQLKSERTTKCPTAPAN